MTECPRTKPAVSLRGRLMAFAHAAKELVLGASPVSERDEILEGATTAEIDSELEKWANSRELKPPE